MNFPAAITFHEFTAINNKIELCVELMDDAIVRQATALLKSDSDDKATHLPPATINASRCQSSNIVVQCL